jgi:hypothetical protein
MTKNEFIRAVKEKGAVQVEISKVHIKARKDCFGERERAKTNYSAIVHINRNESAIIIGANKEYDDTMSEVYETMFKKFIYRINNK